MTSNRTKRIRLTVLLILTVPCFWAFAFAAISTFAAVSREEALRKTRYPIPDGEWMVPNHGHYYSWPVHGPVCFLFLVGGICCALLLVHLARRIKKLKELGKTP